MSGRVDISEVLGHEMATACIAGELPNSPEQRRGRLPLRETTGDLFDTQRRAIIPAITMPTIRFRGYLAELSFLLRWRVADSKGGHRRRHLRRDPRLRVPGQPAPARQ